MIAFLGIFQEAVINPADEAVTVELRTTIEDVCVRMITVAGSRLLYPVALIPTVSVLWYSVLSVRMKKKPLVVTATAVGVGKAGLVWLTHPTYCPTRELVPPPTPMNAALGYDGSRLNCV